MNDPTDDELVAYELHPPRDMLLRPAARSRVWMDESDQRYAYRCLPLTIANQNGWIVECPRSVSLRWSGGIALEDLTVRFQDGVEDPRVSSHFGHGIVTFSLPYLFRTPAGINLWVKGPANHIKDGIQPLEGIVETDWSVAPFTMNWMLTRTDHEVSFTRGEPICMIVPIPRGLAEQLVPRRKPIENDPVVRGAYVAWRHKRARFNEALADGDEHATTRGWEKDYFGGRSADGTEFPEHQTKLRLRDFSPASSQDDPSQKDP